MYCRLDKTIDCLKGEYYTKKEADCKVQFKRDDDQNGHDRVRKRLMTSFSFSG